MERGNLIRLGGVAAMVGGVASAALGLLYVLRVQGVSLGSIENALQKGNYENPVLTVLLFGAMAAIAALHAIQRRHYGSPGALASLVAFVGGAMTVGGNLLGELVPTMAQVAMILLIAGVPAASVGVVGLGIVTIRARVLPRWCGVALIAGSPPLLWGELLIVGTVMAILGFLGLPTVGPGDIGFGGLWAFEGVVWVLVGYAVFRAGGRRTQKPPRVR
jgi:hypothetical protein